MKVVTDKDNRIYDSQTLLELFPVYDSFSGELKGYMREDNVYFPLEK